METSDGVKYQPYLRNQFESFSCFALESDSRVGKLTFNYIAQAKIRKNH